MRRLFAELTSKSQADVEVDSLTGDSKFIQAAEQ
jgi:hypothetical protein